MIWSLSYKDSGFGVLYRCKVWGRGLIFLYELGHRNQGLVV